MRKYFITGLLVLVPLVITLWVLNLIVGTLDGSLVLLPPEWRPESLFGFYLPGFGTLVTLLIVFVTGLVTQNIIGNRVLKLWELLLQRIPVVMLKIISWVITSVSTYRRHPTRRRVFS